MIYFDNAATTYPKPSSVVRAIVSSMKHDGNPGRGGHSLAMHAAEKIYACRKAAAALFGAVPERVIITGGATQALNIAINASRFDDGAILISNLEHNSVLRPVRASTKEVRVFDSFVCLDGDERRAMILSEIDRLADGASMLVTTAASNICSAVMPIREIGAFCREHGIMFIVDGAQAGGVLDINVNRDNIDVLCLPGHKGLYGPMGCGLMILGENTRLEPLLYGGSGIDSRAPSMPELPPERFEAGTLPTPLAAGLCKGIEFVENHGTASILAHETALSRMLKDALSQMGHVRMYAPHHDGGIVLFNIDDFSAEEVAAQLDLHGICTRAGLHCAPLAHDTLESNGAVRISFGVNNTENEVHELIRVLEKIK